jgi:hypothetical protein
MGQRRPGSKSRRDGLRGVCRHRWFLSTERRNTVHLMIEQITDWTRVVLHHATNGALPNLCQKGSCSTYCCRPKTSKPSTSSRTPTKPSSSRKVNRSHWLQAACALLGTTTLRSMTLVWSPHEGNDSRGGKPVRVDPAGPVRNYCLSYMDRLGAVIDSDWVFVEQVSRPGCLEDGRSHRPRPAILRHRGQ